MIFKRFKLSLGKLKFQILKNYKFKLIVTKKLST
jgi:hypothetical protein